MIIEDYVSFETAKLLKEKGFDIPCDNCYDSSGKTPNKSVYGGANIETLDYNADPFVKSGFPKFKTFSALTLQMAMKWLREVHNVHISIYPFNRELPVTDKFYYTCDIATSKLSSQKGHLRGIWKTYEEAVEAALKDVLETLI